MLIWVGDVDEGLGKRFLIAIWIILLALVAAGNLFWTPAGVYGIILGGVVAGVNALGIWRDTKRLVKWRNQAVYFVGWTARMILAILIIATLVLKFPDKFSLPGIFIGITVVPITFLILVIQMQLIRKKKEKKEKKE
ncbi:MAG TPA: hypothetical protein ENK96_03535 [Desulfobulbaceae bacterium]|nr:hypothetical protein [Desulfobulbaceae bacterium]HHH52616.1 hypothetical protein [Bacteroidota bacterium]